MKLFFWDYWFSYVFIRYQKWGQEDSAHIFAIVVLSALVGCNILVFFAFFTSDSYIKSEASKNVLLGIYGFALSVNGILYLTNRRYLKVVSEYQIADHRKISKMKSYFWIYLCATVILLIIAFSI